VFNIVLKLTQEPGNVEICPIPVKKASNNLITSIKYSLVLDLTILYTRNSTFYN